MNFSGPTGVDDSDKVSNEEGRRSERVHCPTATGSTQQESLFIMTATRQWIYIAGDLAVLPPPCRVPGKQPMQAMIASGKYDF